MLCKGIVVELVFNERNDYNFFKENNKLLFQFVMFTFLIFAEPPIITDPASVNANHTEGTHVNISCKATGKPDPHVMWFHNGQVKNSGSKTAQLTFIPISKKDTGMYTCRANNSAGTTEKQVNLVVNCKFFMISCFHVSC